MRNIAGDVTEDHLPESDRALLLRFFYSPERRSHPDAKTVFIEPDLAPLPVYSPGNE